ncbi:DNA replication/repair protein RecF [Acholeplasma granularum]|uniref:DNA replication/repair protein RecF n=1 Tax=Acholeplasma granularum TaxID=264635 RepID=UPI0004BC0D2C|nr:DNA replication/repair protein RecF [Acholeplasma granularum]
MIKKIELRNFRNLNEYQTNITKPLIIIEGQNGVGKTSILEAIYFAATTKSHRTNNEKDMITYDKPYAAVKVTQENQINEIILSSSGKRTSINKQELRKISDYIGRLNVVMFAPEDLMLIKGSPSERRYFLDMELMQISKKYLKNLNTYKKILKQRNTLLKKNKELIDYTFLNILGEQLYSVGTEIFDDRQIFINQLNEKLKKVSSKYKNFNIEIIYDPNISKENWLKHLKTKQKQDIFYETTTTGIHKDDFKILYNGLNAKDNASQGTSRLIVIELKLALLEWIKEVSGKDAVLLLDDVLSELDLNRQNLFLSQLSKNNQVFITSAVPIEIELEYQKIVLQ